MLHVIVHCWQIVGNSLARVTCAMQTDTHIKPLLRDPCLLTDNTACHAGQHAFQGKSQQPCLVVQCIHCCCGVQGVFHVELKYTSQGPRLIEVNCRMGGGPVRNTNLLVWGVDLVEEHLLTCAGIPSRPPVAARPLMYIAEYSINAQKSGKMQHIDFLKVSIYCVQFLRTGSHSKERWQAPACQCNGY